jgi:hypothetical protein
MTMTTDNTPPLAAVSKTPPSLPILITISETRRQLGDASRAALYRLFRQKKLRTAKIGRKRLVFFDSVRALAEESACDE